MSCTWHFTYFTNILCTYYFLNVNATQWYVLTDNYILVPSNMYHLMAQWNYCSVVTSYPCFFLQPYRDLIWMSCNKMEKTSDENYNVIILSKTTNHSLSAVQYTRCAEKHRNSQSQSSLSRYSRGKGKRGKGQSSSKHRAMQSGKVQISMRDLTFLDDGDEHVASSNGDGDRRPDHWDAEIVPAMVSISATSDDDDSSMSEQRRPRLDLVGDPLS